MHRFVPPALLIATLAACEPGVPNGTCVPPGDHFQDTYACEEVGGPTGEPDLESETRVEHDPETAADPDYAWVVEQVRACSCVCCHGSEGGGRYVWDVDFAPAFTDSAFPETLDRLIGRNRDPDLLPRTVDPADNHGFERVEGTGLPTQDADRLIGFIERELERRRGG